LAKRKKKHKKSKPSPKPTQVKDLGAQEIIRVDDKLYRLPDYKELKMGLKHIYGVYNSNLQKYYARNLLCPQDHKINTLRFLAGEKLEALAVYSAKQKSITFNWDRLDNIVIGGIELFVGNGYDAEQEFNEAMKSTKNHQSMVWDLIVNDIPVGRGKRFLNLQEALDLLRDHFKMS
jgi:hypothetical protein